MKLPVAMLLGVLLCLPGRAPATTLAAHMQVQADRAAERLERLRRAYAAGAVSRRELEEAEEEASVAQRHASEVSSPARALTLAQARQRVDEARGDYEKAAAKARKLQELYKVGVVSRNDATAAQTAADQAEVFLRLDEELARHIELLASLPPPKMGPPIGGSPVGEGGFTASGFFHLQDAFYHEFHRPLPVSAFGPSETHEKMGFDHEGRIDIALHPDSTEGRWLIARLESQHIPFVAFRQAVPGKATGPHIHMGFPSPPLARGD